VWNFVSKLLGVSQKSFKNPTGYVSDSPGDGAADDAVFMQINVECN